MQVMDSMYMSALRNIKLSNSAMQRASLRLSTGKRINSAADDPAGMAIASKLQAMIRGLYVAERNIEDAMSLLQVKDGALDGVTSMLQRMNELAVQSANGTLTDTERGYLDLEFQELKKAMDSVFRDTEFNRKPLFGGSSQSSGLSSARVAYSTLSGSDTATNEVSILKNELSEEEAAKLFSKLNVSYDNDKSKYILESDTEIVSQSGEMEKLANGGLVVFENGVVFDTEHGFDISDSKNLQKLASSNNNSTQDASSAQQFNSQGSASSFSVGTTSEDFLYVQTGALDGQGIYISNTSVSTQSIGVDNLDIKTAENAGKAIEGVQKAIDKVSSQRAVIGAQVNRLEHTLSFTQTYRDNLEEAYSRITDADMAKEMMNFVKAQVSQQASMFVLAQAKAGMSDVLYLLRDNQ